MIMKQRPCVKCFQEIIFSVIELVHNYWEVEFSAKESLDFLLSPLLSVTTCRLLKGKAWSTRTLLIPQFSALVLNVLFRI